MAIQFTGLASGLDTQSIIADLMKLEKTKVEEVKKDKTRLEWKKEEWEKVNKQLYSFYTEDLFKFKTRGTYLQRNYTSSDEAAVKVSSSSTANAGTHEIKVDKMAKGSNLNGAKIKKTDNTVADASTKMSELMDFTGVTTPVTINIKADSSAAFGEDNKISIGKDDTISDVVKKINGLKLDKDINVNYDASFGRMFMTSKDTGSDIQISIGDEENDAGAIQLINALGFATTGNVANGSAGQVAEFSYNGTNLTSESNEVKVNGLSLTLLSEGTTTNITAVQDTDAVYKSVKDFILKYNGLLMDLNTKIEADSSRGYNPLTTEEKAAMSEDEVKLWEDKIKKSIFRRDGTLSSIKNEMRSIMTTSNGVDSSASKYNYLSDLGIVTWNHTEKGVLHIEGDKDDPNFSLKKDKLRKAIEDNPEEVMELLAAVGSQLYDKMTDRLKSTSLSSALTIYNDKLIKDDIKDYDKKISDLEKRMSLIESRYYKQFTAMEQAIQKSNSTGSWLSQQLAGLS